MANLIQKTQPKESAQYQPSNQIPQAEDIYVPGIGVRAALGNDRPDSSGFWCGVGETWTHGAMFVSHVCIRIFGDVNRMASSLAAIGRRIGSEVGGAITHRPRFPVHLTNSTSRYLQRKQNYLSNRIRSVSSELRSATNCKLARLTEASAGVLQQTHSRLLRAPHTASTKIRSATNYRASLLPIPEAMIRDLRKTYSFVLRATLRARNLQLVVARSKASLRIRDNYTVDLPRLRRAVPALAVVLVMIVFVIQALMSASAR
jgi:hypothetical protein